MIFDLLAGNSLACAFWCIEFVSFHIVSWASKPFIPQLHFCWRRGGICELKIIDLTHKKWNPHTYNEWNRKLFINFLYDLRNLRPERLFLGWSDQITSLQKRRNSHVTQRLNEFGGEGMTSLSTMCLICPTVWMTFRRRCGVIATGSAFRRGIE